MTPEGLQTFLDESPTKTLDLLHHIQSFNFSWGEVWIHFAFAVFFQRDGVLFSTKWRFGVRYQCHHHLSHDIINHHLVYCSRFEVIEVYILPYLGKKTILCNGFMIFFPYLQNVGRRSCRGTPPETPPIAGPDIRIRTDGERQKYTQEYVWPASRMRYQYLSLSFFITSCINVTLISKFQEIKST